MSLTDKHKGLIHLFSQHPVAANLLMVLMCLTGYFGLRQLNTQLFPSFDIESVRVKVGWHGASAEEVETLITSLLEKELKDVDFLKQMTSTSAEGMSIIYLLFEEDTDMSMAVDQIKQRINNVNNLPNGAGQPKVTRAIDYEGIASFLVTGPNDVKELRSLIKQFERDLLNEGISKVFIKGLPKEEISIEMNSYRLHELGLSLDQVGDLVSAKSKDIPVGIIGHSETSRQLRFRERKQNELEFEDIQIMTKPQGRLLKLGDIATVQRKQKEGQVSIYFRGKPAVEVSLNRSTNSDSLESAKIFQRWMKKVKSDLPDGVVITPFNERWKLLHERINLLAKNGISGLILVVSVLFLFINGRVAWWIAIGIPVSFMAALGILYVAGGSINMISLFALIMVLGIIVDDAIVVGENAMVQYEHGTDPLHAGRDAALRMIGPVFSSSLTTISAFVPLLLVGGIVGTLLQAIPVVVVCVIIASLVECFLVMPGHLTHSFQKMQNYTPWKIYIIFNNGFDFFKDKMFRPCLEKAVIFRWTTLSLSFSLLLVTIGWIAGGRLAFNFFPTAEADRIYANVSFVSGTPASQVQGYLLKIEKAVRKVEIEKGEKILNLIMIKQGTQEGQDGQRLIGDQFGSVRIELSDPDQRNTRNKDIIQSLKNKLPGIPGLENLSIIESRAGPAGNDIDIRIIGSDIKQVKRASERLQHVLRSMNGVSGVKDDTRYGREQMILKLTPVAQVLGLSLRNISEQLRAAYDGYRVQAISNGFDELVVNVQLPKKEKDKLSSLDTLNIVLPNGNSEMLSNLADITFERGFDSIRHSNGTLAVTVLGNVDPTVNNSNAIRSKLESSTLPELQGEFGVQFLFEGQQADQSEAFGGMKSGLLIALFLIYFVLSWIFESYGWPLMVMIIIPFSLIGAIWGHVVMGQSITLLSLFGFFGLSGIVVNNSIILVVFYKNLRKQGVETNYAVIEATCQRLRAVLLTSLTTVAGLTPLLFETSLQAQFLIPMATSIAFGLAFATILVLFLLPALLLFYENSSKMFSKKPLRIMKN